MSDNPRAPKKGVNPFGPGGHSEGKGYVAPKGTRPPNMRELARMKAEEMGVDPFEILLLIAGNRFDELYPATEHGRPVKKQYIDPEVRMKAAAEAAKFVYPTLKSVEHTGENGGPLEVLMNLGQDGLERRLKELEGMLGTNAVPIEGHAEEVKVIASKQEIPPNTPSQDNS